MGYRWEDDFPETGVACNRGARVGIGQGFAICGGWTWGASWVGREELGEWGGFWGLIWGVGVGIAVGIAVG